MLSVSHLTKRYGSRTAVDAVSFTVPRGSVFALLGENGAGKTTAVRCMCGLLAPDGGEILYETDTGAKKPSECREIFGLSPQENAVGLHLTAEENLRLMADLYGVPEPEARTAEMLSLFGLEGERRTRGKALSGGMGRRLSIAMAMISSPAVLFLDEPTLGLDVMSRRELWRILGTLRGKMTVILTTHYMEEAEALADRIAVMKKGKIAAMGSLEDLRQKTGLTGGSLEAVFVRIMEGGAV
ncbi:MAG: ABC transporter ATP-binding protein [Clostridia bacterium]|nr:ABC transporter ATP-binding protein [Clostridia bacterium]